MFFKLTVDLSQICIQIHNFYYFIDFLLILFAFNINIHVIPIYNQTGSLSAFHSRFYDIIHLQYIYIFFFNSAFKIAAVKCFYCVIFLFYELSLLILTFTGTHNYSAISHFLIFFFYFLLFFIYTLIVY